MMMMMIVCIYVTMSVCDHLVLVRVKIKKLLTYLLYFFNTFFVSSHMYSENPKGTQVIVGSKNMGYIFDTARNRTHNLFRPKREPIPLCHSDGQIIVCIYNYMFVTTLCLSGWK